MRFAVNNVYQRLRYAIVRSFSWFQEEVLGTERGAGKCKTKTMVVMHNFLTTYSLERCLSNWRNTKNKYTFFENDNAFGADGWLV